MLSNRPTVCMFPHIFPHSQLPRVIINVEVRKKPRHLILYLGKVFAPEFFFLSRSAVWVVSASNVLLWQEGKRSSVPNGEPFFLSGKGPFSHTSSLCNFFFLGGGGFKMPSRLICIVEGEVSIKKTREWNLFPITVSYHQGRKFLFEIGSSWVGATNASFSFSAKIHERASGVRTVFLVFPREHHFISRTKSFFPGGLPSKRKRGSKFSSPLFFFGRQTSAAKGNCLWLSPSPPFLQRTTTRPLSPFSFPPARFHFPVFATFSTFGPELWRNNGGEKDTKDPLLFGGISTTVVPCVFPNCLFIGPSPPVSVFEINLAFFCVSLSFASRRWS